MGQYTSYWLYQKYEKRGSQEAIPVYPNVYSVDGDGTMSKVIKIENDAACGYVPTGTTQYRWVNLDPSVDYYCDECPTPQYRWTNSGTTCVGYDKYQRAIKQVSYDNGQTWENVSPAEYSATTLIQADSPDCGYVEPIYRWIKSDDTICVEATAQYRTISGTPYCTGYDKYVDVYSQVSYDSGSTWTTTATTPTLVKADSEDCGYVPPTPPTPPVSCTVITYTASEKLTERTGSASNGGLHVESFSGSSGQQLTMTSHTFDNGIGRIEFDDNIAKLGKYAFQACFGLTSINLPNCVTNIGYEAFSRCSGLTSFNIPNSVTSIGQYAFHTCSGLTGNLTIPDSVTEIGFYSFANCTNLTSINISNGVTWIYHGAFYYCTGLTSVNIGNSVAEIGNSAFTYCTSLTSIGGKGSGASVEIPSGLTKITYEAFKGCSGLTSIEFPSGVTSIGDDTFAYCSSLTSIVVDSNNTVYDSRNNCNAIIKTNSNELVRGCKNTIIPNSVRVIGNYAFSGCFGLTANIIPSWITSIGSSAFRECSDLTSIEFPSRVGYIGESAFRTCSSLTSITCLATTPPTLGDYAFRDTNNCPIYVPASSVSAYKSAFGWSSYKSRIKAIR